MLENNSSFLRLKNLKGKKKIMDNMEKLQNGELLMI